MSASPDSHALLDVSRGHLVAQVHHKLGELLDVDDVFRVLRVRIDDLCASVEEKENHLLKHKQTGTCTTS